MLNSLSTRKDLQSSLKIEINKKQLKLKIIIIQRRKLVRQEVLLNLIKQTIFKRWRKGLS